MTRTVAAIRLAELPVAAVRMKEPDLYKQPLAVVDRGRVICGDRLAQKIGLAPGMPEQALSPRIVRRGRASLEEEALRDTVHKRLQVCTPLVEEAPNHLWLLDVTGTSRVHRVADVITVDRTLKDLERELSIPAIGGVAPSRGVALAAEAAAYRSPLQWVRVMAGQENRFMAPLPITLIPGIGRAIERRLIRLGVERMEHLVAVPSERLVRAFGRRAIKWREIAQGVDRTPIMPGARHVAPLQETLDLRAHSQGNLVLQNLIADACERLGALLRQEGRYAQVLTVSITYLDGEDASGRQALISVSNRNAELLQEVWACLERVRKRRVMLRSVTVKVVRTVGAQPRSLFDDPASTLCRLGLDEAVDAIRGRFGWGMIGLPRRSPSTSK
jgi:DNA polymerase-4